MRCGWKEVAKTYLQDGGGGSSCNNVPLHFEITDRKQRKGWEQERRGGEQKGIGKRKRKGNAEAHSNCRKMRGMCKRKNRREGADAGQAQDQKQAKVRGGKEGQ
jgi:hypothetical protein